jgi:acyl carrier protein
MLAARYDGRPLDEAHVARLALMLFLVGVETTSTLIGAVIRSLMAHPAHYAELRGERSLVKATVEEVLRCEAPVQTATRLTAEPCEIDGQRFTPGERVVVFLGAANRDPRVYAEPDRFDPRREGPANLAFGEGAGRARRVPRAAAARARRGRRALVVLRLDAQAAHAAAGARLMPFEAPDPARTAHLPRELNGENARRWAKAYLGHLIGRAEGEIDLFRPFSDYGLDSMDAVVMAGEMEEHFAAEIDPALFLQESMTLGELIAREFGPPPDSAPAARG